jgi:threonine dehydratase
LAFVDEVALASDPELLSGVRALAEHGHVLAELSATAGWVGAWQKRTALTGKRVGVVVSGANITLEMLQRALAVQD